MTKTEIIEAAFRVWGRRFYLDTSLSTLSRELGVSKPALYRHFENKQALLDAMTQQFFDNFTANILAGKEKNQYGNNQEKKAFFIIRSAAEYYAQDVNAFIFSLTRIYDRETGKNAAKEMAVRGVDLKSLNHLWKNGSVSRIPVIRMIFATIIFFMAIFHKQRKSFIKKPPEDAINARIDTILEIITRGYGYSIREINNLDYKKLENFVSKTARTSEDNPLLKAVALAVAEAGPWDTSMEQVARRSGLSKSSLYGHFKNKQDMLRRFFISEFRGIIEFTRQGMEKSDIPVERFYLCVFSIIVYLRSKPEILTAMDWIRTRRIDGELPISPKNRGWKDAEANDNLPPEFLRLFEGIEIKPLESAESAEKLRLPQWVLFIIIGALMKRNGKGKITNEDSRVLFRFLTLGIRGFQ